MKALTFAFFAVVLAISIANAVEDTENPPDDTTSIKPSDSTSTAAPENVTTTTKASNSSTNSPSIPPTIPTTLGTNNKTTTKKPKKAKKAKSNAVTISNLPQFIIIFVSSLQYVVASYWKN